MRWKFWHRDRRRARSGTNQSLKSVTTMGIDPLDPHGDGTLRAGDQLFDMIMNGSGPMVFNRIGDTEEWEAQTIDYPDPTA